MVKCSYFLSYPQSWNLRKIIISWIITFTKFHKDRGENKDFSGQFLNVSRFLFPRLYLICKFCSQSLRYSWSRISISITLQVEYKFHALPIPIENNSLFWGSLCFFNFHKKCTEDMVGLGFFWKYCMVTCFIKVP